MKQRALVLGGGLDGLVAASLLARQGLSVVLCEERAVLGGLHAGEEFHPGFRTSGLLHEAALPAELARELGLERHGLEWLTEEPALFAAEAEGEGLSIAPGAEATADGLARRSTRDAEAYRRWRSFLARVAPFVRRLFREEAPDLDARAPRQALELLRTGFDLRRLGEADMLELLRVGPMCAADWMRDHFESERLSAALVAPALEASWLGPWSAGSALLQLARECTRAPSARGGPAAIVDALAAAARAAGVELRTGAAPKRLLVDRSAVRGLELDGGGTLEAPLVLSTLDPRRTFLELVPRTALPADLEEDARHFRQRGTSAKLHLALDRPLELRGAGAVSHASTGESLDDLERAFDAIKYGRMSERPLLDLRQPSLADPRLAPAGKHVASILVHYAPYELEGGWTAEARSELERRALDELERVAPGARERILAVETLTPADIEKRYGLRGGHLFHGEPALDQLLFLRPSWTCPRHRTPIEGLFIAGPGTHPGPFAPGTSGRLAARAMLASRRRVARSGH